MIENQNQTTSLLNSYPLTNSENEETQIQSVLENYPEGNSRDFINEKIRTTKIYSEPNPAVFICFAFQKLMIIHLDNVKADERIIYVSKDIIEENQLSSVYKELAMFVQRTLTIEKLKNKFLDKNRC